MAPRVQFYHNTPDPLALACELVGRAYGSGRKVVVRMPDDASAQALDRMLWTLDRLTFIPHVLLDSPLVGETPIVIASAAGTSAAGTSATNTSAAVGEPVWPHTDMLFNLAPDLPPAYTDFKLMVEIVGQREADKLPARARWSKYREHGLALKAFDAELRVAL